MSLLGRTFSERYLLTEEVGAGAMGVVYKAYHLLLQRKVVIKTLREELSGHEVIRERFRAEAMIQANLTHSGIVRATDYLDGEEGLFGIVMDHIDGPDLEAHLYDEMGGTMSLPRIGAVMLPVMDAMIFAHQCGVVHRDLKPANIMLDRAEGLETPKVTDFGVAKLLGEGTSNKTRDGSIIGTPSFMPPEQLKGVVDIDHRVDVYALGVILYQLASGHLPFGDGTEYEITYKVLSNNSPVPLASLRSDLSPAFIQVVEKAMAFDRGARYQTVEALKRALEGALSDDSRVAHAAPPALSGGVMATLSAALGAAGAKPAGALSSPSPASPSASVSVASSGPTVWSGSEAAHAESPSREMSSRALVAPIFVVGLCLAVFAMMGTIAVFLVLASSWGGDEASQDEAGTAGAMCRDDGTCGEGLECRAGTCIDASWVPTARREVASTPTPSRAEEPTPPRAAAPVVAYVPSEPSQEEFIPEENVDEPIATYRARLSSADHFNGRGVQLTGAADIIAQDRANYHRFKKRDYDDGWDSVFSAKAQRLRMRQLLAGQITPALKRKIVYGRPLVEVKVWSDYATVRVLD